MLRALLRSVHLKTLQELNLILSSVFISGRCSNCLFSGLGYSYRMDAYQSGSGWERCLTCKCQHSLKQERNSFAEPDVMHGLEKRTHTWRTLLLLEERQTPGLRRCLFGALLVSRHSEASELVSFHLLNNHACVAIARNLSVWELTGRFFFAALLEHIRMPCFLNESVPSILCKADR